MANATRGLRRALLSAALLLPALPAAAPAQDASVHEIRAGSDVVAGEIAAPGGLVRLPIRLVEGSPFSLDVAAAKRGTLRPRVVLLGTDRREDGEASAAMTTVAKGARVLLKDHPPAGTGLHWIEITGAEGTTGAFTLRTKEKAPRGAVLDGSLVPGGDPVEALLPCPGRATATVTVRGTTKGALPPAFASVVGPDGKAADPGIPSATRTGFVLRGARWPLPGVHRLGISSPAGGASSFSAKARWKVERLPRRTLDAAQVIADPVPTALVPGEGAVGETLDFVLAVDFAREGAEVEFRLGASSVKVPASAVDLAPGEASFTLGLGAFLPGTWDVLLRNPDGGEGLLEDAFRAVALPPELLSAEPSSGFDHEVVRLRVLGSRLPAGSTVELRRPGESIAGALVSSSATEILADLDLRGRTVGTWDVAVVPPGAAALLLPGAFEILHGLTVLSIDPPHDLDGAPVEAAVGGTGFTPGATVRLVHHGEKGDEVIEGASVAVEGGGLLTASFDTAGAPVGSWDVVVTLPGGAAATLPDGFETRGPLADPVNTFSASATADAPPAVAWSGTRDRCLVAWVEEDPKGIILAWYLYAVLLDREGNVLAGPVRVSDDGGPAAKRCPAAAWDDARGEFLVVWSERRTVTPTQNSQTHPNGKGPVSLFQVMAQRLSDADLTKAGTNVQVSDHTGWTGGGKDTWYLGDFDNLRPSVAHDRKTGLHEIAWMAEFDSSGLYSTDDWNVFQRTFDPGKGALGTLREVAVTPAHEGDPSLAWDPDGERVLRVHNAAPPPKYAGLDLFLGTGSTSFAWLSGNGDYLADPALAVDPASRRALLTWTRVAGDGTRSVEAGLAPLDDLSSVLGKPAALASGGVDLLARPSWNDDLGEVHACWTRVDGKGMAYQMLVRLDASGDEGPAALGGESEISGGSGDEGWGVTAFAPASGETVVVWLSKLTSTGAKSWPGDVFPSGTVRGVDFWFRRVR